MLKKNSKDHTNSIHEPNKIPWERERQISGQSQLSFVKRKADNEDVDRNKRINFEEADQNYSLEDEKKEDETDMADEEIGDEYYVNTMRGLLNKHFAEEPGH